MKGDESESTFWDNQFKEDVKSGRFFWLTNKHVMDFERGNFKDFWMLYENLSEDTKKLADENFSLLKEDPKNPSLHLVKVGRYWSMRIGEKNRALGVEVGDEGLLWCWIGCYADYEKFCSKICSSKN
tara:strand:- start:31086 stop:31466 length:381 start_codon:yes stop_codon:yes gene_type:complete